MMCGCKGIFRQVLALAMGLILCMSGGMLPAFAQETLELQEQETFESQEIVEIQQGEVLLADAVQYGATSAVTMSVGDQKTLSWSSTQAVTGAAWTSSAPFDVVIVSSSWFSCIVEVKNYPTLQPVVIQCQYSYLVSNGSYSYTATGYQDFQIDVLNPAPTSVSISATSLSLEVGDAKMLSATVLPSTASTTLTWSSLDKTVATVSQAGVVTAVGLGTTTIEVCTENNLKSVCTVTVTETELTLVSTSPTQNQTECACAMQITATFASVLQAGETFDEIRLRNIATDEAVACSIEIQEKTLVLIPENALEYGVQYQLSIPIHALENTMQLANQVAYTLVFTTKVFDVIATTPENGSMQAGVADLLEIETNVPLVQGEAFEEITLQQTDEQTQSTVLVDVYIQGTTLVVAPTEPLLHQTSYCLLVPENALANQAGVSSTQEITLAFTTDIAQDVFAGGDGTAESPYGIATQEQLKNIALDVTAHYELLNDIVLDGLWSPIATSYSMKFSGTFDGNGYAIRNFNVDSSLSWVGLFGRCEDALIQNLTIETVPEGISITQETTSAYVGLLVSDGSATIDHCVVKGSITVTAKCAYQAALYAGCFAGRLSGGSIQYCENEAALQVVIKKESYVGGMVGYSSVPIVQCTNVGDVTVTSAMCGHEDEVYIGGVAGYAEQLTNCTTSADVIVRTDTTSTDTRYMPYIFCIGGLVGKTSGVEACTVENCTVQLVQICTTSTTYKSDSNKVYLGGLAGKLVGTGDWVSNTHVEATTSVVVNAYCYVSFCVGGFIGEINDASIKNCSVTGGVYVTSYAQMSSTAAVGGLVGNVYGYHAQALVFEHCAAAANVQVELTSYQNYQNVTSQAGGLLGNGKVNIQDCSVCSTLSSFLQTNGTSANAYRVHGTIVGVYSGDYIRNCYAEGGVYASVNGQGVVYRRWLGTDASSPDCEISNCYYVNDNYQWATVVVDETDAIGYSKEALSNPAQYEGWDFENVWLATEGLPVLRNDTLASISVTSAPTKTCYLIGDTEILAEGIVVFAQNADGTSAEVLAEDLCFATIDACVGQQTIAVSYTHNGVTKIATFEVQVQDILQGDVTEDFEHTIQDAILLLQYLAQGDLLTPRQISAANIVAPDEINTLDCIALLEMLR